MLDEENDFNDFSLGDTSFCRDGLSVGKDYLRFEGITITRGKVTTNLLSMEETIGRGAFNKVQRAIWNDPESKAAIEVAVKEYPLLTGSSPMKRQMLIQELQSLCKLDHPCLVKFHGAFLQQDSHSIIMAIEYMNRGSLEHVLEKRKTAFSTSMVAGVAYQLLHGVEHLHSKRILHRDIKTEQCLLHSDGSVKLCDFGIASLGDRSLHKTVVGTTKFMAPERLRAKQYGRSSDIWSLGLVLRHLATGEKPWSSVSSMVDLIVTVEETSSDELIPSSIKDGFRDILASCLRLTPQKRMPASIMLQSPWFSECHGIASIKDAAQRILDNERITEQ